MRVLFPPVAREESAAQEEHPRWPPGSFPGRSSWSKTTLPCGPTSAWVCAKWDTTAGEAAPVGEALLIVGSSGGTIDTVVSDVVMRDSAASDWRKPCLPSRDHRIPLRVRLRREPGGGIGALCGRFDLITKPFSVSDLVSKIREGEQRSVLSASRGIGAARA